MLKCSIRGKTISFSAYLKKENQNTESNLEEELTKWQEDFETTPSRKLENQIKELEEKQKTHREKQINAIMTRAKARWEAEGEKCTNYFCNLEKRHNNEKIIPKLILNTGDEITDQSEIINEQKLFMKNYICPKILF